ncbi:hypothetical protein RUND412_002350 [Rhizina undulata]
MAPIAVTSDLEEYDYIVCGGGTAGSVVAARLAETEDVSVLVIEAGQHNNLLENTQMVGGWLQNFDTPADWNIVTEPNPSANNRRVKASRGRFLGGCSGCNGTLVVRGTRQDYDDWDMPGWSGDEFWKYMNKSENFHPNAWFKHSPANHGTKGLLHTEPHDLAPISQRLLESMDDQGLPLDPDMFSAGNNPHGCGHSVRTHWQGLRTTAADFVTSAGSNLALKTETTVDKVVVEKKANGELRAIAVDIIDKDGKQIRIKAREEIVVSGGGYCSPAILMRSGLGPKEELEKHEIETKLNLPGVGKNLMDHLIVFQFYETEVPKLTNDHLLYHGDAFAKTYKEWKQQRTGALSTFPFGAFAYARLDERLKDSELWNKASRESGRDPMGLTSKQPNVEFFTTECYGGPKQNTDFPIDGKSAFAIIPELFSPRSRGTVALKSRDPMENPLVYHNYLGDPLDLEALAEACAYGNEIVMRGRGTRDIVKAAWPATSAHHLFKTRDEWKPFVREHATTCYHPGGTCKMGKPSDPMAVVDERLRVRGVKGLRIADTSIMPKLNQGHTQMPAYGIGEKCADLIKEDAGVEIEGL